MDSFFDTILPEPEQPAPPPAPPAARPLTADDVRQKMIDIIAALQGAMAVPFETAQLEQHKRMFPIMAMWLPDAEGQALVEAFDAELKRLSG